MVKLIEEFDLNNAEFTGGVTGSRRVWNPVEQAYFQLKPSILDNAAKRRLKAGDSDHENLGEVLSCIMATHLFPHSDTPVTPNVCFVYDPVAKRMLIASEYMKGDSVQTLDEYAMASGVNLESNSKLKHVSFVRGEPQAPNEVSINSEMAVMILNSLAKAIVVSALFGDHDVNPGNMLLIKKFGIPQVARIDFGHAFYDLLRAPNILGGQLQNERHPIKDFFNRSGLASLKAGGDVSKLWRDYPGLAFSSQMARALIDLREISSEDIGDAVNAAKQTFISVLDFLEEREDKATSAHLLRSLSRIHQSISGSKPKEKEALLLVEQVFGEFYHFLCTHRDDAVSMGRLMEAQLKINELVWSGTPLKSIPGMMGAQFQHDRRQWLKESKHSLPFIGTLQDFIVFKAIVCKKQNSPDDVMNKAAQDVMGLMITYRNQQKVQVKDLDGLLEILKFFRDVAFHLNQGNLHQAMAANAKCMLLLRSPLTETKFMHLKSRALHCAADINNVLKKTDFILKNEKTQQQRAVQKNMQDKMLEIREAADPVPHKEEGEDYTP